MTDNKPEPPEVPAKVRAYSRAMVVLVLATIVLYLFGVPIALGAGATAIAAIVVGILALVASRGHERMGPVRISIGIGMAMSVFAIVVTLVMAILYDVLVELRDCEARALTQTAQRECTAQYEEDYRDRLAEFGVTVPE